MSDHLDRAGFVAAALASDMGRAERKAFIACVCLAACDGTVDLAEDLLAPVSGHRRGYLYSALKLLELTGWLVRTGEGSWARLHIPQNQQGN